MQDLTGGHLAQFLLAELFPVISRHPRFRDNDGSALTAMNNLVLYKDVSLVVGNLRANGQRQSFDHFMCTVLGRSCVAKLDGHTGTFVEWIKDAANEDTAYVPGIYYLAVDAVDEAAREVRLIQEAYRWLEGRQEAAYGSRVHLHPNIPTGVTEPVDPALLYIDGGRSLTLLTYTPTLSLRRTDSNTVLAPGQDYWVEVPERHMFLTHPGGAATNVPIPRDWVTFRLLDERGVELRHGQDWDWDSEVTIWLAPWLVPGDYYMEGVFRRTPTGTNHIHPENFLTIPLEAGEALVAEQTGYTNLQGSLRDLVHVGGDRYVLGHLLQPGDTLRWEARIRTPQVYKKVSKMAVNYQLLPGVDVAIGDQVVVGDQVAILVFPHRCEVYEVYGAKDTVAFDITVRSNDLLTSTELGNLVKAYMLVEGRDRLETAGLTVFEIATSYGGEVRDSSGTAVSHPVTLSVSGMGDWEYHKPLVNRVDDIDVSFLPDVVTYPGAPRLAPALVAFGISRFTPSYQ